jgi:hypothetical protein
VVLAPDSEVLLGSGWALPKNDPFGDSDLKLKPLLRPAVGGEVGRLVSGTLGVVESIDPPLILRLIEYLPCESIDAVPARRFFLKLLSESESFVSSRCSLVLT